MAFATAILRNSVRGLGYRLGCRRWSHVAALPAPLDRAFERTADSPFLLPEFNRDSEKTFEIKVPSFSFGGSMELMAVPKKKVSRHKRGIRNGPKALKPIPVIIRCRLCVAGVAGGLSCSTSIVAVGIEDHLVNTMIQPVDRVLLQMKQQLMLTNRISDLMAVKCLPTNLVAINVGIS
ncbi:hypothetical protein HHK36_024678 [Tetracentron sinense]|uniref:Large ribosomal subunit protein bL32m n=1 Tax=Tetracentron sinense TaxID=13715 RepID=A0A834YR64_TETSI|nr:hypothetical protein HHK36_024678 [Tetracentron sinense]